MNDIVNKRHRDAPNGHGDTCLNTSGNTSLDSLLKVRLSRRDVLKGSLGAATTIFVSGGLAGCLSSSSSSSSDPVVVPAGPAFNFTAVAKSVADALSIPTGYTAKVLYRLGDPINTATPAFANDGSDSADSWAARAGDHHDGMSWFGLNAAGNAREEGSSSRGLLCMNHENITRIFLHTAAEVAAGFTATARVPAQIDKEVNAHGVSVIEVQSASGTFQVNTASAYNRRLTAATPMDIHGPARGDDLLVTKYSTAGTQTRGTLNNCANGYTPWGTFLTCEENWAGYFKRPASSTLSAKAATAQNRYMGSSASEGSYGWANPAGGDTSGSDLYNRWNVTPGGADASADFRNAANTMGWVVEVDPYSAASVPRKRTTMGRFGHEGSMPGKIVAGKPVVFYLGDDAQGEYIYKYVSTQNWAATDAGGGLAVGNKYLDDGRLYVAKFSADGSGTWIELNIANAAIAGYANYAFADQADVLINCRLAADAVGATPMDRPEWAGVNPATSDVYVTLTNNTGNRGKTGGKGLDAANPRFYSDVKGSSTNTGNVNGHIVRLKEANSEAAATSFKWDIYLFGAEATADGSNVNVSGLTADNDFSSPDGLWFSNKTPGLMWLQTDDGAYTDVTNCMMLAALPGSQGDGGAASITSSAVPLNGNASQTVATFVGKKASADTLRRFLVGPKGCEITGITETPDGKTIFVNIQHPGENTSASAIATPASFESHWPATDATSRPRSSTIVITKNDGGLVGAA